MSENKKLWFMPCNAKSVEDCEKYDQCERTDNIPEDYDRFNHKFCLEEEYNYFSERDNKLAEVKNED